MKTRVMTGVVAAVFAFMVAGCNASDGDKQASSQKPPQKSGVDAVFGDLTSSKVKKD